MAVKKRCCFCRKYTRLDGTCQNDKCVRFVPEVLKEVVVNDETTVAENQGGEDNTI